MVKTTNQFDNPIFYLLEDDHSQVVRIYHPQRRGHQGLGAWQMQVQATWPLQEPCVWTLEEAEEVFILYNYTYIYIFISYVLYITYIYMIIYIYMIWLYIYMITYIYICNIIYVILYTYIHYTYYIYILKRTQQFFPPHHRGYRWLPRYPTAWGSSGGPCEVCEAEAGSRDWWMNSGFIVVSNG